MELICERQSVWERAATAGKPVVLYGMGDAAARVFALLGERGIPVAGIFASDTFCRGQNFRGYPVERLADLEARLGDFLVLICFGVDYDEMLDHIAAIAARHETYAPDLPVVGEELFTPAYYAAHCTRFEAAYALLADDRSREVYRDMLNYKISGKLEYLYRNFGSREEDFAAFLHFAPGERYVDLGAYDGDTVAEFVSHCPDYGAITAFEPDPKNFRKLTAATAGLRDVRLVPKASFSRPMEATFQAKGGRSSMLAETGRRLCTVSLTSVDAELTGERVDYIKMDVEGAEAETLIGCRQTIAAYRPKLSVAAYHRSEDLFLLPLLIHSLRPDYRLLLRRHKYVPAWEILLYAI